MKNNSEFLNWFHLQAGKPPMNNVQYLKLCHETLPSPRSKLSELEAKLAEMDRYNTTQQYALYAWVAKDKQLK